MVKVDLTKKVADRYLKREVLGEGTYGVVYKAIDTKTGQTVAIKKIRLGKQKEGTLKSPPPNPTSIQPPHRNPILKFPTTRTRATVDGGEQSATATPMLVQEPPQLTKEVEESVKLLKKAAKTRWVAKEEVLSAPSVIEKGKLDPSRFLNMLGRTESPGRTWMLIFTAEKELKGGRYFPITAVQRFDAAGMRIDNGVYFGPFGYLTFEGRFS